MLTGRFFVPVTSDAIIRFPKFIQQFFEILLIKCFNWLYSFNPCILLRKILKNLSWDASIAKEPSKSLFYDIFMHKKHSSPFAYLDCINQFLGAVQLIFPTRITSRIDNRMHITTVQQSVILHILDKEKPNKFPFVHNKSKMF